MNIGTLLSVSYMTGLENTKKNSEKIKLFYHNPNICGRPLVLTNKRNELVTDSNYPLSGRSYCNTCRLSVDLENSDEVKVAKVSLADYAFLTKQKGKSKRDSTIEDKIKDF